VLSFRKNRDDPPSAHSWRDYGRVDQEAMGEPSTGFETSGRLVERAQLDGEELGAARAPEDQAVGDGSGAKEYIAGASKARKGVLTAEALSERLQTAKRVATKPARLAANKVRRNCVEDRLKRLVEHHRPPAERKVKDQKAELVRERARLAGLPRHLKGYFPSALIPAAIELGVVAFDGGALHSGLERAGFSTGWVWYLAVTVPLLVLAVNHALGVLIGAIGQKLGASQLKVAVGVFVVGFAALVVAFVMLTIFRGEATAGQNSALAAWAGGKLNAAPSVLISPIWLGPAQVAGSIAAIVAVAFFTMEQEGREVRAAIGAAEHLLARYERELAEVEADIESAQLEHEAALTTATEIEADVAEAQAQLDAHEKTLAAKLQAEDGLAAATQGRLRTRYRYVAQIYSNGGVVRVALATVTRRFGRRYTPPPGDAPGEPYRPPADRNGHRHTTPDDLRGLVED
jgi:hypothetical protein